MLEKRPGGALGFASSPAPRRGPPPPPAGDSPRRARALQRDVVRRLWVPLRGAPSAHPSSSARSAAAHVGPHPSLSPLSLPHVGPAPARTPSPPPPADHKGEDCLLLAPRAAGGDGAVGREGYLRLGLRARRLPARAPRPALRPLRLRRLLAFSRSRVRGSLAEGLAGVCCPRPPLRRRRRPRTGTWRAAGRRGTRSTGRRPRRRTRTTPGASSRGSRARRKSPSQRARPR